VGNTFLAFLLFLPVLISPVLISPALAADILDCLVCHDTMKGRVKTAEGVTIDVHIDAGKYGKAVHGKLECTACHRNFSGGGHGPAKAADVPAEMAALAKKIKGKAKLEPVAYAACIQCHEGAYKQWLQSVHAKNVIDKGSKDGAICTDCHGAAHYIQPKGVRESKVNWAEVVDTCGRCHEDPGLIKRYGYSAEILKRYKESFHGKKHKLGQKEVPTCASCHGYHGVWKWTDPQSPMSVDKRKETCGRCHPGATDKFVGSITHKPAGAIAHYTEKGLIVLVLGTFAFIFFHVILNVYADIRDWIFRKGGGHE